MKRIAIAICLAAVLASCQQKEEPKTQYLPSAPTMQPDAVTLLQDVVKRDPKNIRAWIELGNTYMDTSRFQQAVEAYGKALDLDPKNVDVRVDRGTCYRNMGMPDLAEKDFRKALEMNPNHAIAHRNLGVVLAFDLKKKDQAIKEFERYLQLSPSPPDGDNIRQTIARLKTSK